MSDGWLEDPQRVPGPMDSAWEAGRPEPRRFQYPLADPCRGAVSIPAHREPVERFPGDYGGEGWESLGLTGFDVRACMDGANGQGVPLVRIQYRPNGSPRLPEEFVSKGDVRATTPHPPGPVTNRSLE